MPIGGKPTPDPSWKWYGGCPPVGFVVAGKGPHAVVRVAGVGWQNE